MSQSGTPLANRRAKRSNANTHPTDVLKEFTQLRRSSAEVALEKAKAEDAKVKAAEELAAKDASKKKRLAALHEARAQKDAQAEKQALRIDTVLSSESKGKSAKAREVLQNAAKANTPGLETINIVTSDIEAPPSDSLTRRKTPSNGFARLPRNVGHGQFETTSECGPLFTDADLPDSPTQSEAMLGVIGGADNDNAGAIEEQLDDGSEFVEDPDEFEEVDDDDEDAGGRSRFSVSGGGVAPLTLEQISAMFSKNTSKGPKKNAKKNPQSGGTQTRRVVPPPAPRPATKKRGRDQTEPPVPLPKRPKPTPLGGLRKGFPLPKQTAKGLAKGAKATCSNIDEETDALDAGGFKGDETDEAMHAMTAHKAKNKVLIQVEGGHSAVAQPNKKILLHVEETTSVFKHPSKLTIVDLPFCSDPRGADFRARWTASLQPSLRLWAGTLEDPFNTGTATTPPNESPIAGALEDIFARVYPELRFDITRAINPDHKKLYLAVASNCLGYWRSNVGKNAGPIVEQWLREHGLDERTDTASRLSAVRYLTNGLRFIYSNPDGDMGERGPFQSSLISAVFSYHLSMTKGADPVYSGNQVGGLALATAAVVHGLNCWASSKSSTGNFGVDPWRPYTQKMAGRISELIKSDEAWDAITTATENAHLHGAAILGLDEIDFTF